jgi:shikimate kinase
MDMRLGDSMAEIFGHKPFQSFRDIENQIVIKPASSDAGEILTALGR